MNIKCESKRLFDLLKLAKKERGSLTVMGAEGRMRVTLAFPEYQYTLCMPYTGDPQIAFTIAFDSIADLLTVSGKSLSFDVLEDGIEVRGDNGFVMIEGSKIDYEDSEELPPPFMAMPSESLYKLLPSVYLNKSLVHDYLYKCSKVEIKDGVFYWINTDGVRLVCLQRPLETVVESPDSISQEEFVIKDAVLIALKQLKLNGRIYFGKRDFLFIWNDELVFKMYNIETFPEWRAVIPQDAKETARVSTTQIIKALKEIKVPRVILYGKDSELNIHGEERNKRQFQTVHTFIPMEAISHKEGLEFQTKLLLDLIQCNPSPMTHLSFGVPTTITSAKEDWKALIMIVRR